MIQQTRAIESTYLHEGPDANTMIVDNAKVASPDALQLLPEVLVVGPDAGHANPSLSRIRVSKAYLKRLIGCVISRIPL
jgi:hypothetical protein